MSTEPVLLTAAEADARAGGFAVSLAARRVGRGERVLLAVPTYAPGPAADLISAVLGALRAGVVPVVLDAATPARELAEIVADCTPAWTLTDPDEVADAVRAPGVPQLGPPLGRAMHYTSGTTGRRKGVASGVLSPEAGAALWREESDLWGMTPADVHLVMSPLYHSAPLRFALATLLVGGKVLCAGKFDLDSFAAAAAFRPTTTFTAPAQLARLREAGVVPSGFDWIAHAGAPCPEPVKRWLIEAIGAGRVREFYGSTEGQFTACTGEEWLERPGTVGRARPGRTLRVDDDGVIWCAVPPFARFTYWGAPEKTARAWHGDEFSVGDVGRLDDDGYLYLVGRREDLIISGGVNVYPAEVERVLGELPGVLEVAVFGVDDDRWGQRVEAAVRGSVTEQEVLDACAELLPPARRPKRVHVLDDLPRTSTGKILRRELSTRRPGPGRP
ncbi:class I adenylate-forming enzyme family protein [Spongisporangium articulatum]|uniref:Class I adenylate-forming enzyme family protein n=1 Tax=Spongisporangium articulatum TaxID=3362603 RepID=A0ABW8ARI2_9ACTN